MQKYLETNESAIAQATIEQLAVEDVLTGLYKRYHFLFLTGKELERSHRFRRSIAMILVDLDHFHIINDRFGSACGDQALTWVSGKIKSALRSNDSAGRYAGEKFAILMPAASCEEARAVAERIRQEITAWESPQGDHLLTASVGVVYRACGGMLPPAEMLFHATEALDIARREGRNRVALHVM